MKSRNKVFTSNAYSDEYMQACFACTYFSTSKKKESNTAFETKQLYATEAEDYFFYFIPKEEMPTISIAV
jgi:hypothetical protein